MAKRIYLDSVRKYGIGVGIVGVPLTVSADLATAGKLVEVASAGAGYGGTLPIVGVVDRYDSAAGLLYFTQQHRNI